MKEKVELCREELMKFHDTLGCDPRYEDLITAEVEAVRHIRFLLSTIGSIMREKSTITWLRDGDSNSSFFHVVINDKTAL